MADEVLVWCDVRKNIGVLQFILGLKEPRKTENNSPGCDNADAVEITVKRDCVVVKKNEKVNEQSSEGKKASDYSKRSRILFQGKKVKINYDKASLLTQRLLKLMYLKFEA